MKTHEIRRFLLKYAAKNQIAIEEFIADDGTFFCHLQGDQKGLPKSSTAVSNESPDNALIMAFFSFENPLYNFLD